MIDFPKGQHCRLGENCRCMDAKGTITTCSNMVESGSLVNNLTWQPATPGPLSYPPTTPTRQREIEGREAMEQAADQIDAALILYKNAYNAFQTAPRDPRARRRLQANFAALSEAQFRLERAFDMVPPKAETP